MSQRSRVLVVDPDHDHGARVSQLLGRAGYDSVEAEGREDALAAANEQAPSLVLLEVALPNGTGYEVCCELKERFGEDLPIVFLSGVRTEPLDRAAGLLLVPTTTS